MSKWTQKRFNAEHAEPRDYGEAWAYVVGNQFTDDEQVAKMLTDWEQMLTGSTDPDNVYTADMVTDMPIGIGQNEDGQEDWVLLGANSKQKPIAWGRGVYL